MARKEAIGFVETFGLAAAVACADAGVKGANVELLGYEYTKGDGMCTVKFAGNVGAVKSAIEAGKRAAEAVNGTLNGTKSTLLKSRPADGIKDMLIYNAENVGGEIALAKGVRPKATNRPPVLVKNWKPKEEPHADEAPEPPVVETPEETAEQAPAEETPVEAPVEEAPVVETPAEEKAVEEAPAPAAVEETPVVEAPVVEAPAEEAPAAETKPVEEAPAEEAPIAEATPVEDKPAKAPKAAEEKSGKKTSTGKKTKSRKKKGSDKTDK